MRNNSEVSTAQYVALLVGVNDVDRKSGEEVFNKLREVVDLVRDRYEQPKIILAELTPRMDDRDAEVKNCNVLIEQYVKDKDYLFSCPVENSRWSSLP